MQDQVKEADLILSNNDFSVPYDLGDIPVLIPPVRAGWGYRRKHAFFEEYNQLALEFSGVIGMDSDLLTIKTRRFKNFLP